MPQITNQKQLIKNGLNLISNGPTKNGWSSEYLKCPICSYFVYRGPGNDKCTCGNISIDSDVCRVSVRKSEEKEVKCYDKIK